MANFWFTISESLCESCVTFVLGAGGTGYQQATQCRKGDAGLAGSLLLHFIWSSSRTLDHIVLMSPNCRYFLWTKLLSTICTMDKDV